MADAEHMHCPVTMPASLETRGRLGMSAASGGDAREIVRNRVERAQDNLIRTVAVRCTLEAAVILWVTGHLGRA